MESSFAILAEPNRRTILSLLASRERSVGEIERRLRERGLQVARNLVGNYITSLEMAGGSLTLLELDDELVDLWDAPVHTPALRWGV